MHRNILTSPAQRQRKARLVLAGLLVLALLWTQSLGLWHRLVHYDAGHVTASASVASSTSPAPSGKLFSNHHSDIDCQLFDQLSHADGVTAVVALALGLATLPQFVRSSHALAVARWHAQFQARGPPSVR